MFCFFGGSAMRRLLDDLENKLWDFYVFAGVNNDVILVQAAHIFNISSLVGMAAKCKIWCNLGDHIHIFYVSESLSEIMEKHKIYLPDVIKYHDSNDCECLLDGKAVMAIFDSPEHPQASNIICLVGGGTRNLFAKEAVGYFVNLGNIQAPHT
jgi:hypothetical protein